MNKKRLGCITTGGLIALAITFVFVGVSYALTENQMFSPGDLSSQSSGQQMGGIKSHEDLENHCQSCHPAPWDKKDMGDLCLDCHTGVQAQITDIHSLHGAVMIDMTTGDCRLCHTDHRGISGDLTIYDGNNFPHYLVGYSLQAHQQLEWDRDIICQDCHPSSFRDFDPIICSDCHFEVDQYFTDAHITSFDIICTACHDGVEGFNHNYDHSQANFQLTGAHLETACVNCHIGAKDLTMFDAAPSNCSACHLDQDIHAGNLGSSCEDCHNPTAWSPALFDHYQTGFILDGSHFDLSCDECHLDPTFQGLDPTCISCHLEDDAHQNQLGSDCAFCHVTTIWGEVNFNHEGPYAENCSTCHQGDAPINHYQGQCSACHVISAWLPATFNHTVAQATDCLSCHTPDRPENHFPGQCSICHFTTKWKPANLNHTFPINHHGAGGTCSKCHTTSNYYAYTCYVCHEHSKTEVKKEHEGISNLNNCIRCHWDGRKHDDGGGDDGD